MDAFPISLQCDLYMLSPIKKSMGNHQPETLELNWNLTQLQCSDSTMVVSYSWDEQNPLIVPSANANTQYLTSSLS